MKGSYKNSKQGSMMGTMNEEDEGPEFVVNEIERLQESGINMQDINKLKSAGFSSVKSVLMATKKELQMIKGITEQRAEKLQDAAKKLENAGFITGYDQLLKR
jgi:ERCC4-type nuclease